MLYSAEVLLRKKSSTFPKTTSTPSFLKPQSFEVNLRAHQWARVRDHEPRVPYRFESFGQAHIGLALLFGARESHGSLGRLRRFGFLTVPRVASVVVSATALALGSSATGLGGKLTSLSSGVLWSIVFRRKGLLLQERFFGGFLQLFSTLGLPVSYRLLRQMAVVPKKFNPLSNHFISSWNSKQPVFFFLWMFGETTIFHVKIWNHPIETTIYKEFQDFMLTQLAHPQSLCWSGHHIRLVRLMLVHQPDPITSTEEIWDRISRIMIRLIRSLGLKKKQSLHGGKHGEKPVSVPSKGFYEILVSMEVSSSPSSLEETLLGVSVVWKNSWYILGPHLVPSYWNLVWGTGVSGILYC